MKQLLIFSKTKVQADNFLNYCAIYFACSKITTTKSLFQHGSFCTLSKYNFGKITLAIYSAKRKLKPDDIRPAMR